MSKWLCWLSFLGKLCVFGLLLACSCLVLQDSCCCCCCRCGACSFEITSSSSLGFFEFIDFPPPSVPSLSRALFVGFARTSFSVLVGAFDSDFLSWPFPALFVFHTARPICSADSLDHHLLAVPGMEKKPYPQCARSKYFDMEYIYNIFNERVFCCERREIVIADNILCLMRHFQRQFRRLPHQVKPIKRQISISHAYKAYQMHTFYTGHTQHPKITNNKTSAAKSVWMDSGERAKKNKRCDVQPNKWRGSGHNVGASSQYDHLRAFRTKSGCDEIAANSVARTGARAHTHKLIYSCFHELRTDVYHLCCSDLAFLAQVTVGQYQIILIGCIHDFTYCWPPECVARN